MSGESFRIYYTSKKLKKRRVVITGLGVVAPNGVGLNAFKEALMNGISGITHLSELEELSFSCQLGGVPPFDQLKLDPYLTPLQQKHLKSYSIRYGVVAALDAWRDADLEVVSKDQIEPDWESGTIFGTGISGMEVIRESIYKIDEKKVKRLGSAVVEQTMGSGISAYIGGILGLGNQVTTNSSACSTGTEAVLMGYARIRDGSANRMLVGSCDSPGPYVWGGFDSMRVLNWKSNDAPEKASRPMSATASGFIPGAGAGALVLEDYDTAVERNARIYAEILGGHINSGGQREGGTMTAPNSIGIQRCIQKAVENAGVNTGEIDGISGHLTSTMGDILEVRNWADALNRHGSDFPYIHSLKSMIGHCLGAAGSIECVGTVLELYHGFFHASLNCEDLHPGISVHIDPDKVPQKCITTANFNIIAKSSFGFGDVNSCIILQKAKE